MVKILTKTFIVLLALAVVIGIIGSVLLGLISFAIWELPNPIVIRSVYLFAAFIAIGGYVNDLRP